MISEPKFFPLLMMVFSQIGEYEETMVLAWFSQRVVSVVPYPRKCTFDHPSAVNFKFI